MVYVLIWNVVNFMYHLALQGVFSLLFQHCSKLYLRYFESVKDEADGNNSKILNSAIPGD